MPVSFVELDSSTREENITIIVGKNILLKIIEDPDKQTVLRNNVVKKFVSITDLCHDDTRNLIEELIREEAFLNAPSFARTILNLSQNTEFSKFLSGLGEFESSMGKLMDSKFLKSLEKEVTPLLKQKFEKMPPSQLENMASDIMHRFVGKIDEKLVDQQNKKMVSIGDKIKEMAHFDVLVPSTLILCPKCRVPLSMEEYRGSKKCHVCGKKIAREKAKRIYIHKVNDKVKEVWKKNLWFEAYMAKLLRRLGFKTWTSVHVMGASGILHEVDVLAIRKGTVLTCECKTGKVSRNDVFNFCTKVGDLKNHISILALVKKLPETETREFVKKNPAIIRLENMGETREANILDKLRDRLLKA